MSTSSELAPRRRLAGPDREFAYNTRDFERVKERIYQLAGISLAAHKEDLVYNRLVRRLRALSLDSFEQYIDYLDHSNEELNRFINAMTTNLTSFFRESHHFDYLSDVYIPKLAAQGHKQLRVWSSGCSVGEEPYSMAISLLESGVCLDTWDIKIWATDIDTNVLDTARQGVYDIERIESLSIERKRLAFLRGKGQNADKVCIKDFIKEMMHFEYCNLMEQWPLDEPMDIIFCRNVMIYFDKETQNRLLDRMTDLLKPGGILCIGHSETPSRSMKDYKVLGRTMYQKL